MRNPLLVEVSWEVANQVGGIYSVLRSKVSAVQTHWKENYLLIGPYMADKAYTEFEPLPPTTHPTTAVERAVARLRSLGFEGIYIGRWRTIGNPCVVLFDPATLAPRLAEIKYFFWKDHYIEAPAHDELLDQLFLFAEYVTLFILELERQEDSLPIVHFHEWLAGVAIPRLRYLATKSPLIFTTHATLLGRYLAMNTDEFYKILSCFNWQYEAQKFNIMAQVALERAAAHGAHLLTTVSELTAKECEVFLGRTPDFVIQNGLNIDRFMAVHEFQNLHKKFKNKIHEFCVGHFFPSYTFDLDKTIYFFTSGRFEYKNKGLDVTLEAISRLNQRLKENNIDKTVVFFLITKRSFYSVNPQVLQRSLLSDRLKKNCESIIKEIGEKLFFELVKSDGEHLPDFNNLISDYWLIHLRKGLKAFKSHETPPIVTHSLVERDHDQVLHFLRERNLLNQEDQKVKVVYHPDFISSIGPINQLDYDQFVRGCHLGIFPSFYEPWGLTPLECMASAIPAVTSDTSGFGDSVLRLEKAPHEKGIYVLKRKTQDYWMAVEELTEILFSFVQQTRRERIEQRNRAESFALQFDWKEIMSLYQKAYQEALSFSSFEEDKRALMSGGHS